VNRRTFTEGLKPLPLFKQDSLGLECSRGYLFELEHLAAICLGKVCGLGLEVKGNRLGSYQTMDLASNHVESVPTRIRRGIIPTTAKEPISIFFMFSTAIARHRDV